MKSMEQWQRHVLDQEGLIDWNIVIKSDPYCWIDTKTIQLPDNASRSLFLHEVAHALHPFPEPYGEGSHYHGGGWALVYGTLIDKYLSIAVPVAEAACDLIMKVSTVLRPNVSFVDFKAHEFNLLGELAIKYTEANWASE